MVEYARAGRTATQIGDFLDQPLTAYFQRRTRKFTTA
jgi:hypothetical protein